MEHTHDPANCLDFISPISQLNQDALLRIFKINADIGARSADLHPLDVTRRTSQVCRYWRELIIGSPSIWGGLIDLDVFAKQNTGHWRNEVMKRTGQALLSIVGAVKSDQAATLSFFRYLMTNDWSRIREFHVRISTDGFENSLLDMFWENPAPNLERFSVNSTDSTLHLQHSGHLRTLFLGQAPSLQSFHGNMLDFDYQAPWIPQLYSITLSSPLTVIGALEVLSRTPCLRELIVWREIALSSIEPQHRYQISQITLPNLLCIKIENCIRNSVTLLEHIVPVPKCDLFLITIDNDPSNFSSIDFQSLHPIVSRFAESYFSSTAVADLTIGITAQTFLGIPFIADKATGARSNAPFCLNITCRPRLPYGSTSLLLSTFSKCRLSTVINFEFLFSSACGIDPEDPAMIELILGLTSVEQLTISEYGLKLLNDVSLDNSRVFPSLRTVKPKYLVHATLKFPETLVLFLSRRKNAGVPVFVLDVSDWAMNEAMDWGFLDEVKDLRVIWEVSNVVAEYVCGSGERQRLHLWYLRR